MKGEWMKGALGRKIKGLKKLQLVAKVVETIYPNDRQLFTALSRVIFLPSLPSQCC